MQRFLHNSAVLGVLAAAAISAAWWVPGSITAVVLGWITVALLVVLTQRTASPYWGSYLSGFLIHPFAFYWLFTTIKDFGNFPWAGAAVVFFIFAALSGLQYPLYVFICRRLPSYFDGAGLRTPIAWTVTEFVAIRIFPWNMGHSQLAFVPFAQTAALGGSYLISFLMFWLVECALQVRWKKARAATLAFPGTVIAACIAFGILHQYEFDPSAATQKIAMIQANIGIDEKHAAEMLETNREKYLSLSRQALAPDTLIIWPESVIVDFIPDEVGSAINEPRLPYWQGSQSSFLVGALTYRSQRELFNSAVAVFRDGTVPTTYHKRILMPFGEYTPFGDMLPWLRELDGILGDFSAGRTTQVFHYPITNTDQSTLEVAPLICYEDVVPGLSREAVAEGAQLLVNITNDAWFGNTVAPYQHHLIASFRAIEQHRYLARTTNTGLTAIVNPLGQTAASLPPYTEGILRGEITPLDDRTVYSAFGDLPWWILAGFTALCVVATSLFRRFGSRKIS